MGSTIGPLALLQRSDVFEDSGARWLGADHASMLEAMVERAVIPRDHRARRLNPSTMLRNRSRAGLSEKNAP